MFTRLIFSCTLAVLLCLPGRPGYAAEACARQARVVSRAEILKAMQFRRRYDPTATTNGARFHAETLLHLIRRIRERLSDGPPLFIGYAEWFSAFLEATGRTEATAPAFSRLAYQHKQNMVVDYHAGCVIRKIKKGTRPELALNVKLWWEKNRGIPKKYSYQDTLSTPHLKVTDHRVLTYRLLAFRDWILFDKIKGLTGRPTTGALSVLFRLIGEGRIVQSRMIISQDGLQVSRVRAKKAFWGITATVTVAPDGRVIRDAAKNQPDLAELDDALKPDIDIEYMPYAWPLLTFVADRETGVGTESIHTP